MEELEIFARHEDRERLERIVAQIDPGYRKYINLHNTGETIFVAKGGPELVVQCMANGATAVARGSNMADDKAV